MLQESLGGYKVSREENKTRVFCLSIKVMGVVLGGSTLALTAQIFTVFTVRSHRVFEPTVAILFGGEMSVMILRFTDKDTEPVKLKRPSDVSQLINN